MKRLEFIAACIVIAVASGMPILGVMTGPQVTIERRHQEARR